MREWMWRGGTARAAAQHGGRNYSRADAARGAARCVGVWHCLELIVRAIGTELTTTPSSVRPPTGPCPLVNEAATDDGEQWRHRPALATACDCGKVLRYGGSIQSQAVPHYHSGVRVQRDG
jgi:hypothetical protein